MAKIHGLVYIAVGAFLSYVAWAIDFVDLKLFFYLGFLFAAIGIFKIIFLVFNKKEKEIFPKPVAQNHPNPMHSQAQYKRCPRCYNVMRAQANFCSSCGFRI